MKIPYYTAEEFTNFEPIGSGGGGVIRKGKHVDFGSTVVAVKQFFPSADRPLEKYKKEIEILLEHRHPNIVNLYGILYDGLDKSIYLGYVMDYAEGGSLHAVIYDPTKNYSPAQIYRWICQIGIGLQYLHKNGIIHRDVKPQNILIAGEQLKLADFGISRDVATTVTDGVGTYAYMAPEVIETNNYGLEADIYSLAITSWEIFHRKRPSQQIVYGKRPALDCKMDEDTANFVRRCWHPDSGNRPKIEKCVEFFGSKVDATLPSLASSSRSLDSDQIHAILVLGGYDNGKDEMVILKQDKWINLALKLPKELRAGGAVYMDGEIYVFGGRSRAKELYKLDNKTLEWIRLADMNEGRLYISNSSVEWNGSIWVFGGDRLKSVERYDPKENKWIKMPDMKYWRSWGAAAVHNGKFIVCGGLGASNYLKSVECFDPESGVWTEMNDMPTPLFSHSLVSHGNNLILMGGSDGKTRFNTVLGVSNLEGKGTWKQLPPMKQPRNSFSAAVLDNEIFVIGGWNDTDKYLDKTEIFNGKSWREGPFLPNGCCDMSSIVIPRHLADTLSNFTV